MTTPSSILIRARRKKKGLTQAQLADRLGVSERTVIRLEKPGDLRPDKYARGLREALGGRLGEYQSSSNNHVAVDEGDATKDLLRRQSQLERELRELRAAIESLLD